MVLTKFIAKQYLVGTFSYPGFVHCNLLMCKKYIQTQTFLWRYYVFTDTKSKFGLCSCWSFKLQSTYFSAVLYIQSFKTFMTTGSLYFLSNDFTENISVQNSFPIDELENWCHQRLVGVPQKYKTQEVPWQPSEQQPALQKTPNQHHYTKGTSGEIFLPNLMLKVTLFR